MVEAIRILPICVRVKVHNLSLCWASRELYNPCPHCISPHCAISNRTKPTTEMSIIFQNNNVSFGPNSKFSEAAFAGFKFTTNGYSERVTTTIRMMHLEHRDRSRSVYAVPIEIKATLPEHANITING